MVRRNNIWLIDCKVLWVVGAFDFDSVLEHADQERLAFPGNIQCDGPLAMLSEDERELPVHKFD